jgi:hypothetical protein
MAAKGNNKGKGIQVFMKEQLEQAQRRFGAFEADAEKALRTLISRGRQQRKDLETLKAQLDKRANEASTQVLKRLDLFQTRVVEATGVASQAQVRHINRELSKLAKKVDTLVGKRPSRTEASM